MDKSAEKVLVVPEARFREVGEFHGFLPYSQSTQQLLLDPAHLQYLPRREVETDPRFKQLIPYVVLRCGNELFHYTRGKSGSETRLQALRSIGIGGHICDEDISNDPYRTGMLRELNEEVEIQSPYCERLLGFIYDGRTPVGEVHVGIVHLFDLDEPLVWPREAAIDEAGFASIDELYRQREQFETWSQFAIEQLKGT